MSSRILQPSSFKIGLFQRENARGKKKTAGHRKNSVWARSKCEKLIFKLNICHCNPEVHANENYLVHNLKNWTPRNLKAISLKAAEQPIAGFNNPI